MCFWVHFYTSGKTVLSYFRSAVQVKTKICYNIACPIFSSRSTVQVKILICYNIACSVFSAIIY